MRCAKSGDFVSRHDLGHQLDELRIVVEHLLEMRHEPALIDAVAREAAAEMIVDAALRDMGERQVDRLERIGEPVAKPARHRNPKN